MFIQKSRLFVLCARKVYTSSGVLEIFKLVLRISWNLRVFELFCVFQARSGRRAVKRQDPETELAIFFVGLFALNFFLHNDGVCAAYPQILPPHRNVKDIGERKFEEIK